MRLSARRLRLDARCRDDGEDAGRHFATQGQAAVLETESFYCAELNRRLQHDWQLSKADFSSERCN